MRSQHSRQSRWKKTLRQLYKTICTATHRRQMTVWESPSLAKSRGGVSRHGNTRAKCPGRSLSAGALGRAVQLVPRLRLAEQALPAVKQSGRDASQIESRQRLGCSAVAGRGCDQASIILRGFHRCDGCVLLVRRRATCLAVYISSFAPVPNGFSSAPMR